VIITSAISTIIKADQKMMINNKYSGLALASFCFLAGSVWAADNPAAVGITPDPINVPWSGTAAATATITPESSAGQVSFAITDGTLASVTPGSGSGATTNLTISAILPGSTTLKATQDGNERASVVVNVIKVNKIQVKIGTASSDWKDFGSPQKILLGRRAYFKATEVLPAGITVPSNFIQWSGTYGFTGTGVEPSGFTYSGAAAATDSDTKDVKTNCGPDQPGKMLVCQYVIGVHSNTAPTSGFTSGHAWISVSTFTASGGHTTITYGLWPDDHPLIISDGLANGSGSDVRVNREPATGLHNRYYLLTPSQNDARVAYVATSNAWGYFFTCADWASAAYAASTGESVSASDYVLFGTPRAISGSIKSLEDANPTQLLQPEGGGDDASSTSAGTSGGGSSFP
jgi:hypothetical protein